MDILGPAWKDTVNYFTKDFVTLFDSESSWWKKGVAAAFIIPWRKVKGGSEQINQTALKHKEDCPKNCESK